MTELHGWGRYPRLAAVVSEPASPFDCSASLAAGRPLIARGMGRSYGDSALGANVLSTRRLDRFRAFDTGSGELACDAGVSLDEILRVALPRGWFLPVTPGTRFVSVGGAVASDVHGKDHHVNGTFGAHVREIELLLGNGERVAASPTHNADLFRATCGGMGLTGVILGVRLQLRAVASSEIVQTSRRLPGLEALLAALDTADASTYSVAWLDTTDAAGRGVLLSGEHAPDGTLEVPQRKSLRVPMDAPSALLNPWTARAFNLLHYRRAPARARQDRVGLLPFFYPLDGLADWNRLYGRGGFLQYQFVVPREPGPRALREVLDTIAASGETAFLSVLKKFGPANDHLLSFPMEGYTLALDFKATPGVFALLERLDAIVLAHGGRLYLAKDARMSEATFKRSHGCWEQFEAVRERWHATGRFASAQSRRLGLA